MATPRVCPPLLATFALLGCLQDVDDAPPEKTQVVRDAIVGGTVVDGCGWPVTVGVGNGCSGALVHPQAITTAVHCNPGPGTTVRIGPTLQSPARVVTIAGCVENGTDAAICELSEAVADVPFSPIIYGCEAAQYITVGQAVVFSGFGVTQFGGNIDGQKRWASHPIEAVLHDRIVVGPPGVLPSPCPGDSGGPVHVQVADGSWRVIGSLLGGTTGIPCNSAASYHRSDFVVPKFEQERGIDITPCFDAATGDWEPSADCTGFYAGSEVGTDTWSNLCAGEPKSGLSQTCGAPYEGTGGAGGDATGGHGGTPSEGGSAGEGGTEGAGGSEPADDDEGDDPIVDSSSCGCTVPGDAPPAIPPLMFAALAALVAGLRRRSGSSSPPRV